MQTLIDAFVQATVKTMKIQVSIEVTPEPPPNDGQKEKNLGGALILTNDSQVIGDALLCFEIPVFLKVYSSMLGEPYTELTFDMESGASELMNIIFGLVKAELNGTHHYKLAPTIPSAVRGVKGLPTDQSREQATLFFQSEAGGFHIYLSIIKNFSGGSHG